MKKRIISCIMCGVMIFSLTACGTTTKIGKSDTPTDAEKMNADISADLTSKKDVSENNEEKIVEEVGHSKVDGDKVDTIKNDEKTQKKDGEKINKGNISSLSDGTFAFGLDTLRFENQNANGANVLISPYSIYAAMSMAMSGADGDTFDEMANLLYISDEDRTNFTNYINYLVSIGNTSNVFTSANGIYVNENMNVDEDEVLTSYLAAMNDNFGANAEIVPFDTQTVDSINDWVASHTNDKIQNLISDLDPLDELVLINATYFKDKWKTSFDEYYGDFDFVNSNGESAKDVSPIITTLSNSFVKENANDSVTVAIPYQNGFTFVAVLPDKDVDIQDFINNMPVNNFTDVFNVGDMQGETDVVFPEFEYSYANSLVNTFMANGMTTPFSSSADFSRMASVPLYIGDIYHSTYIHFDKEGTEATGATAITMTKNAMIVDTKNEVLFNRPFVYAIVDDATSIPVFVGVVNNL